MVEEAAGGSACQKRQRERLKLGLHTKKARQRLQRAKRAAIELRFANDFDEFEDAWLDFLLHAKGVYEQLKIACKSNPRARQWFGGKSAERKSDPLLQYIYQARNFAEHEPEPGAMLEPGHLMIGKAAPGMSNSIRIDGNFETGLSIRSLDGKPVLIESKPSTVKLLPVTGRGGEVYQPPEIHLGHSLRETTPPVLADLSNLYLDSLLREAESLKL